VKAHGDWWFHMNRMVVGSRHNDKTRVRHKHSRLLGHSRRWRIAGRVTWQDGAEAVGSSDSHGASALLGDTEPQEKIPTARDRSPSRWR
jgi:hypothetical protein